MLVENSGTGPMKVELIEVKSNVMPRYAVKKLLADKGVFDVFVVGVGETILSGVGQG